MYAIRSYYALDYLLTLGQLVRYPDITFYNYGPGLVRTATIADLKALKCEGWDIDILAHVRRGGTASRELRQEGIHFLHERGFPGD